MAGKGLSIDTNGLKQTKGEGEMMIELTKNNKSLLAEAEENFTIDALINSDGYGYGDAFDDGNGYGHGYGHGYGLGGDHGNGYGDGRK